MIADRLVAIVFYLNYIDHEVTVLFSFINKIAQISATGRISLKRIAS